MGSIPGENSRGRSGAGGGFLCPIQPDSRQPARQRSYPFAGHATGVPCHSQQLLPGPAGKGVGPGFRRILPQPCPEAGGWIFRHVSGFGGGGGADGRAGQSLGQGRGSIRK
ncbi:MAG: hypothetical protein EBZ05_01820, partial [Verrucomicrobia bacterium]|nr:hypothetical protein [Verrucomicrobiota bacterium]